MNISVICESSCSKRSNINVNIAPGTAQQGGQREKNNSRGERAARRHTDESTLNTIHVALPEHGTPIRCWVSAQSCLSLCDLMDCESRHDKTWSQISLTHCGPWLRVDFKMQMSFGKASTGHFREIKPVLGGATTSGCIEEM